MEGVAGFVLFLAFAAVVVLAIVWHYSRSNDLLHQWAERHGYRIVRQEYRNFFKGPFFWTTSRGQTVYYVTVEDRQGQQRNGWVRCGGRFLGLLSDNVDVRWDE
jgi:hypothetical protein